MLITREQFERRQHELATRDTTNYQHGPNVGFFSLKNDGDEAIVRFMCEDPEEFPLVLLHSTRIGDGKFKTISCLREDYHDSFNKCPLCAAGDKATTNVFVKLIQYERSESGEIVATPKIWSRSNSFLQQNLVPKYEEYGSLKEMVCRIKRYGAPNQKNVSYIITRLNQDIYSEDTYKKDEHVFDDYNVLGRAVKVLTFDQMSELVGSTNDDSTTTNTTTSVVEPITPTVTNTRRIVE